MRVIFKLTKRFDSPREAYCALTSDNENVPPSPRPRSTFSPITIHHVSISETPPPSSPAFGLPSLDIHCPSSPTSSNTESSSQAYMLYDNDVKMDMSSEVSVLSLYEAVDIIPSFSVIRLKIRQAKVTIGDSSDCLDIFLNNSGDYPSTLPFSLHIINQCSVEVSTLLCLQ